METFCAFKRAPYDNVLSMPPRLSQRSVALLPVTKLSLLDETACLATCIYLSSRVGNVCTGHLWYLPTGETILNYSAWGEGGAARRVNIAVLCDKLVGWARVHDTTQWGKTPVHFAGVKLLYTVLHRGSDFCPLSRNAGCPLNRGSFTMGAYGEIKRVWQQAST